MPTPEIRKHWDRVREMGCVLTNRPDPTLHHCHGGSMLSVGVKRTAGRKPSDWLVIPLAAEFHVGDNGIDRIGVKTWEVKYGTQLYWLNEVSDELGYDVLEKAGLRNCRGCNGRIDPHPTQLCIQCQRETYEDRD